MCVTLSLLYQYSPSVTMIGIEPESLACRFNALTTRLPRHVCECEILVNIKSVSFVGHVNPFRT